MTTTRRNVVTGAIAATLPVAAVAAPAAVDPIFAAIEAHKITWQLYLKATKKAEALRNSLPEDVRERKPRVQVGVFRDSENVHHPIFVYSTKEIDNYFSHNAQLAFQSGGSETMIHDTVRAAYAEFDSETKRINAAYDASGLLQLELATDQPCGDASEKIDIVMETTPTTRDGIVAWIDYIMAGFREGYVPDSDETDADAFLIRLRDAIAKLA
jgi:hypothetical protein